MYRTFERSTVEFRWSWAWNDERGEWEFEKMTKITQYRHNINISIKKRVMVSFYNVSCSLSDTWFAKKRKNIFFTRPTNTFFHFWFDVFMIFDFFRSKWVPCETCGVKVGLKEATDSVASFALQLWFSCKFRANRKTGRIFPPHVSQGTPAFLKITFQLHRNPTVLA